MTTLLAGRSTNSGANEYAGVVLSSDVEIRQLRDIARRLMQNDDAMLDPEFFLASVSKGWAARVVAVYSSHEVVGIMYAKERIISGIPTGIVYADGSLGGVLLATPLHQQNAFRVAVETLFRCPGIRGMWLRVLQHSGEFGAIRQLVASRSLDAQCSPIEHSNSSLWKCHARLPLAQTYDQFLEGLGSTTRHNFRYYRRRFEASDHRFMERLSMDELRSAAFDLLPKSKCTVRRQPMELERELKMVAAAKQPLAVALKHRDGEWLSVIGGWYRPGGAVLCFQCNNERKFGPDSLSVVLRAYLIERLIFQRLEELVIWAGTGPPLSRYVSYIPTIGVRLDVPTYWWRAACLFVSRVGPRLPRRLAAAAQWISYGIFATIANY
jgi:hypothetical protein